MESLAIPPLRRRAQNVSVELVAHLEKLIATGELPAGSRLPSERDLAATMSVSRTSLREAMRELESKNLIERRPGRGTLVAQQSKEVAELLTISDSDVQIHHVMEMRDVFEPEVAGLAALRATSADLLLLQDILEKSSEHTSPRESLRLDDEFHNMLAHAAQNPILAALGEMSTRWTVPIRSRWHTTRDDRSTALNAHWAIFNAVEAHDQRGASHYMREHLAGVRAEIDRTRDKPH